MNRSDTINEIVTALAKAQGEFRAVVKGKKAQITANNSYSYADLATVCEVIVPVLSKNGIAVIQGSPPDNTSVMETLLAHSSGQWIATYAPIFEGRNGGAQGYGSGMTYARRYGLLAAVGVAPEDDDDGAKASGRAADPKATISAAQFSILRKLIEETGSNESAFLKYYVAPTLEEFPADKFSAATASLNAKKAKTTETSNAAA